MARHNVKDYDFADQNISTKADLYAALIAGGATEAEATFVCENAGIPD